MLRLSTAILAAVIVAGSTAASYAETRATRHDHYRVSGPAAKSRAQAVPRYTNGAARSTEVYEWGKYQGQDPDPNVRLMLRRDFHN
jgi:hypothetical protein